MYEIVVGNECVFETTSRRESRIVFKEWKKYQSNPTSMAYGQPVVIYGPQGLPVLVSSATEVRA